MCRNIKTLYNFEPVATDDEIKAASLQFVRKISGFASPSTENDKAFKKAVDDVAKITRKLVDSMHTDAKPKDRKIEAEKARERVMKRFGNNY